MVPTNQPDYQTIAKCLMRICDANANLSERVLKIPWRLTIHVNETHTAKVFQVCISFTINIFCILGNYSILITTTENLKVGSHCSVIIPDSP